MKLVLLELEIFFKHGMVVEYFKRNNFPFGKEFKLQVDF
jgi:hypothetical protein